MRIRKLGSVLIVAVILMLGLCACEPEVITVADIQEGQEAQYIEVQEFALKEVVEDDGKVQVKHCAVVIPSDYHPSEEVPGMYLNERAPMESSNIYFTVSEGESAQVLETLTGQQYKEEIETAYAEKGQTVEVSLDAFEKTDLDGVPAYKIQSTYTVDGTMVKQLAYIVLADKTYTITYSQAHDDELMADFVVSDSEIKLIKKF